MDEHRTTWAAPPSERDALSEICAGTAALFRARWGRGPHRCRAHWAGPDALLVLLEGGYTEAERTLTGGGRAGDVAAGRRGFHEVVAAELREIVETATGRQVAAFLGSSHADPDITAEVFVFEPARKSVVTGAEGVVASAIGTVAESEALVAEGRQAARVSRERRERRRRDG